MTCFSWCISSWIIQINACLLINFPLMGDKVSYILKLTKYVSSIFTPLKLQEVMHCEVCNTKLPDQYHSNQIKLTSFKMAVDKVISTDKCFFRLGHPTPLHDTYVVCHTIYTYFCCACILCCYIVQRCDTFPVFFRSLLLAFWKLIAPVPVKYPLKIG